MRLMHPDENFFDPHNYGIAASRENEFGKGKRCDGTPSRSHARCFRRSLDRAVISRNTMHSRITFHASRLSSLSQKPEPNIPMLVQEIRQHRKSRGSAARDVGVVETLSS
jgi:hypothetical protein